MATVCGGSLAMMDAGVPLKRPVAGIAMGLILEGKDFAVLSDILGDEDHLGDMDFKVAGTSEGITALQMDIKVAGITEEIMKVALAQAKDGRAHILGEMAKALDHTREELSAHAPRIETMQIPKDKIREVIGTGGKVIREIVATTGAKVDIDDEGLIKISSSDLSQIEAARQWIHGIVAEPEPGTIYTGKVASIVDFGAFVTFMPGKDGLVHVSEIKNERVENVRDVLSEGQEVKVKLLEVDQRGKVRLSMRLVDQETGAELEDTRPPREPREGGDRGPRGDRGDRGRHGGGGGDRDRGPRRDGGDRGTAAARRPRRSWSPWRRRGDRGPRREREGGDDDGPAPEFAPAFLTGGETRTKLSVHIPENEKAPQRCGAFFMCNTSGPFPRPKLIANSGFTPSLRTNVAAVSAVCLGDETPLINGTSGNQTPQRHQPRRRHQRPRRR